MNNKKRDSGETRHDNLVGRLQTHIFHTCDYEKLIKFFDYCRNGQVGEVDLLGIADEIFDMYEVKCIFTTKSNRKAHEQYEKFQLAFPENKTNGFLYTGDGRLRRL